MRYFFFSYLLLSTTSEQHGSGDCTLESIDFPSRKDIERLILDTHKARNPNTEIDSISISFYQEMAKEDFLNFRK